MCVADREVIIAINPFAIKLSLKDSTCVLECRTRIKLGTFDMIAPLSTLGSADRKLCFELDRRIRDALRGRTFRLTLLKMDRLLPKTDFPLRPVPDTEPR